MRRSFLSFCFSSKSTNIIKNRLMKYLTSETANINRIYGIWIYKNAHCSTMRNNNAQHRRKICEERSLQTNETKASTGTM